MAGMARLWIKRFGRISGLFGKGRLVAMVVGLLLAVLLWSGRVPGLSALVHEAETSRVDRVATLVKPAPERDDLVFLGIDEASLSLTELGEEEWQSSEVLPLFRKQWPWNRSVWAFVIDRLAEAGAKQIVIDLVLKGKSDDAEAEDLLVKTIAKHRSKVVLAAEWEPMPGERGAARTIFAEPNEDYLGPLEDETPFGYVNFWPGKDGIIRDAIYRMSLRDAQMDNLERHPDEHVFESLSAAVGRKLGALPPDGPQRLRYVVRGRNLAGVKTREIAPIYPPISLYKIFFEETWKGEFGEGKFFKDKVVLIGPAAPIFQDSHTTPAGMIFGGQLHLQSASCLLSDSFLKNAPPHWNWIGLIGMALAGGLLVQWVKNPILVFALAALAVVAWLMGAIFIGNQTSVLMGASRECSDWHRWFSSGSPLNSFSSASSAIGFSAS